MRYIYFGLLCCLLVSACGAGDSPSNDPSEITSSEQTPVQGALGDQPSSNNDVPSRDIVNASFYASHPTSALLSGAVLGDNAYSGEVLSRSIPLQILDNNANVVLENAFATRVDFLEEQSTALIITVFNGTLQPRCFIAIEDHQLIDVEGNTIEPLYPFAGVYAANYAGAAEGLTSSCLPPGERGYIKTSFDVDLDRVAQLTISTFADSGNASNLLLTPSVVPMQYSLESAGRLMRVTFLNQSAGSVQLNDMLAIVLDESGQPVFSSYSFFEQNLSGDRGIILSPGEETIDDVVTIGFRGQASTVRIIVDALPVL